MIFRKPIVQRRRHHQALIDLIIDKTFCHVLFFSDPADVSGPLHTPTRSVFINYLSCPSSTPLQLSPLLPPITESIPDRLLGAGCNPLAGKHGGSREESLAA